LSLLKNISLEEPSSTKSICNKCKLAIKRSVLNELREAHDLTDDEALILGYFIENSAVISEMRGLITFILGAVTNSPSENNIALEYLQDILGCETGIDLVRYNPDVGYKISGRCGLFVDFPGCNPKES
jgi:hypothetical protein